MEMIARDEEHLRLLKIGHYIFGGINAVFSLFPLIHFGLGFMMFLTPEQWCSPSRQSCPPPFIGILFMVLGGLFILIGLAFSTMMILNGRFMGQKRHWLTCLIFSAIECILFPYGTILGMEQYSEFLRF